MQIYCTVLLESYLNVDWRLCRGCCVMTLALWSRGHPTRHKTKPLFWSSSMADIVPLCPRSSGPLCFIYNVLSPRILHYPDPPRVSPAFIGLSPLSLSAIAVSIGICAQRARRQSRPPSEKIPANGSGSLIYMETGRANRESAHERILTPLSNGCERYGVLGSAYNQHNIEGALILILYFEVVQIRISWTFRIDRIFPPSRLVENNSRVKCRRER